MTLPSDLVSQFARITNDKSKDKKESTSYGTIVERDGRKFVKMDGSDLLTPVTTTTSIYNGERVTVQIKNHQATVTGNITSPSARLNDITDVSEKIVVMDGLIANKVDTGDFNAEVARINQLTADNVVIKQSIAASEGDISELVSNNIAVNEKLTANEASITKLQTEKLDVATANTTYATITNLEATNTDIYNLNAAYAEFTNATASKLTAIEGDITDLDATKLSADDAAIIYATIEQLNTTNARIDTLTSDIADIDTLIFGSASGTTIHSSFSNAVIAQLGDAQIKSAMIENISASKITTGDIITNNVAVTSEDGKLFISDETIQISDGTRLRVQIGKDATDDYSINVWDSEGNLIFSEGGITDKAIKNAIIRNDMVSDTANISAHKLDIGSLFEEINDSTNTIKSSKIYLDDENQTLDVAFTALSTEASELGETVSSQGSDISVLQNQISTKVWSQDVNAAKSEMSTKYTNLEQRADDISLTVENHTTSIGTINDRMSTIEADADEITSEVTRVEAIAEDAQDTAVVAETLIKQLADNISMLVTDGNGTSLMTQTESGWVFSTAEIQTLINNTTEGLNDLVNDLGDTEHVVDILQQTVNDLETIAEYIKIGTYDGQPCIELGESDSEFKLRITNTQIMFMEGSGIPAYFTNQSMHIKKAVIEEELQQGGFVWKARSNGNLGLVWKG